MLSLGLTLLIPTIFSGYSGVSAEQCILVFSKTAAFRHDSIPPARKEILAMCNDRKWNVTFSESSNDFNDKQLRVYDVVIFLCTTGDVLNREQEKSFENFVRRGGGYVGIHAAADTEYEWPWYGKLVGAYFESHPAIQQATIRIENPKHPTVSFLPNPWIRTDEWYNYKQNPRAAVTVLASLDETSYKDGKMGADHPIIWCHEFEGGRAWYTGLGHTKESYTEPLFMKMLAEGIKWASGKSR